MWCSPLLDLGHSTLNDALQLKIDLITMNNWNWISSEFLGGPGEAGEKIVWEAVMKAWDRLGKGIGMHNYTDVLRQDRIRSQPDILLVSRDWGLAVTSITAKPQYRTKAMH